MSCWSFCILAILFCAVFTSWEINTIQSNTIQLLRYIIRKTPKATPCFHNDLYTYKTLPWSRLFVFYVESSCSPFDKGFTVMSHSPPAPINYSSLSNSLTAHLTVGNITLSGQTSLMHSEHTTRFAVLPAIASLSSIKVFALI